MIERLNWELRAVGKLPRRLAVAVAGLLILVGWIALMGTGSAAVLITAAVFAVMLIASSLRVRPRVAQGALEVRSYLRTVVVPLSNVLTFDDVPYSGFWNRGTTSEGWTGLGLRMIEVATVRGRAISLPATMLARPRGERVVQLLNALLPDDDSPVSPGGSSR